MFKKLIRKIHKTYIPKSEMYEIVLQSKNEEIRLLKEYCFQADCTTRMLKKENANLHDLTEKFCFKNRSLENQNEELARQCMRLEKALHKQKKERRGKNKRVTYYQHIS